MTKILFRPSELSNIMASAQGKSNREKYSDLAERLSKYSTEYAELKNLETKKARDLSEMINKVEGQMKDLFPMKDLPHLSEGTKTHLRKKMIEIRYARYKDIETKYMTKGKDCEEQAITVYSLIKGRIFENNKERIKNDYLSGEIDLPWRNKAKEVIKITDIKNSYDVFTFFDNEDKIKGANKWQGVGYMDLYPKCEEYAIANVLVNNTADAILTILHRESYKWKDGDTPAWRELQLIKEHIYTKDAFEEFVNLRGIGPVCEKSKKVYDSFVEIPMEERLIEHTFQRDESDIQKIRTRIDECRIYLEMIYGLK